MSKLLKLIFLAISIFTIYFAVSHMLSGEIFLSSVRQGGHYVIKFSDTPIAFIGAIIFYFTFSLLLIIVAVPNLKTHLEDMLRSKKKSMTLKNWLSEVDVLLKYGKNESAVKLVDKLLQKHPNNKRLLDYKHEFDNS